MITETLKNPVAVDCQKQYVSSSDLPDTLTRLELLELFNISKTVSPPPPFPIQK